MSQLLGNVKFTSGGTFNLKDSPLNFIAADTHILFRDGSLIPETHANVLIAVNEIKNTKDKERLYELCESRKVLLDSGIYNLAMDHARKHNTSMDHALKLHPTEVDGFDKLRDRYYELATVFSSLLWGIIELDLGGPGVKPETRSMIERDTGIIPMPVYHPFTDGWDYYDGLATSYDRICFGNLVKASPPVRQRLIYTASIRAKMYPYLWTHLLGVTPNEYWLGCPMRGSTDSSTWLAGRRWFTSWKSNTMLKKHDHFPEDMWYTLEKEGQSLKINAVLSSQVVFAERNINAIKQDTHPCHIAT